MKLNNVIKSVFLIIFLFLCSSAKIENKRNDGQCDQTIMYYISKIKNGDQSVDVKMQIMVDPVEKIIKLYAKAEEENATSFDTVIESSECDFNSDLTKGSALYKGYIKQENGNTTKAMIKISTDANGKLSISNADPDKNEKMIMVVDRWAIVKD